MAANDADADSSFLSEIQEAFPDAAIVGGVCDGGHVRLGESDSPHPPPHPRRRGRGRRQRDDDRGRAAVGGRGGGRPRSLTSSEKRAAERNGGTTAGTPVSDRVYPPPPIYIVEDGIFGLALGGDVPVRSVVSRGMRSLSDGGMGSGPSAWTVSEARVLGGDDDDDDVPVLPSAHHLIRTVRNASTGETMGAESWLRLNTALTNNGDMIEIGLRRRAEGGGARAASTDSSTRNFSSIGGRAVSRFQSPLERRGRGREPTTTTSVRRSTYSSSTARRAWKTATGPWNDLATSWNPEASG